MSTPLNTNTNAPIADGGDHGDTHPSGPPTGERSPIGHRIRLTSLALAVGLALVLAACGGDDSAGGSGVELSGEDAELADALAAVWTEDDTFPPALDARCLANGFVSGIGGAEGAERYDVDASNIGDSDFDEKPLMQGDALAAAGAMWECEGFKDEFVGGIAGDVDESQLSCLTDALSDEPLTGLFASTFMGDGGGDLEELYEDQFEAELIASFESCEISR